MERFPETNTKPEEPDQIGGNDILASESGRSGEYFFGSSISTSTYERQGIVVLLAHPTWGRVRLNTRIGAVIILGPKERKE